MVRNKKADADESGQQQKCDGPDDASGSDTHGSPTIVVGSMVTTMSPGTGFSSPPPGGVEGSITVPGSPEGDGATDSEGSGWMLAVGCPVPPGDGEVSTVADGMIAGDADGCGTVRMVEPLVAEGVGAGVAVPLATRTSVPALPGHAPLVR
ncbi:MAG TPA: hypothetical protein VJM32_00120 [Candidatus Saccharimonadales bacterium]|nr:hypothetical protein [Candidatus Saccharimonadales bacterium]